MVSGYCDHLSLNRSGPGPGMARRCYTDLCKCLTKQPQAFYIWRVYLLSREKWWPTVVPIIAVLAKTAASVVCTILTMRTDNLRRFQDLYSYVAYLSLMPSVVTDVWNTSVLCRCLRLRRTDHSRNIVNWIMIWAIGVCTNPC
jgi:hypothetical protein